MSDQVVSVLKPASENHTNSRVLDLDDGRERPVKLGGREFLIRPQRCAVLQKVAIAIGHAEDSATKLMQQTRGVGLLEEVEARLRAAVAQEGLSFLQEEVKDLLVNLEKASGAEEFSMEKFSRAAFTNFEEQIPTIALILGFEESHAEYKTVLDHLEEHLTFDRGRKIFETWWEVNRIDDFFGFAGSVLMTGRLMRGSGDGLT